jgi:hypothetical protein
MPAAAGGWVNLSDYMAANKGAGEEMSAAGAAEVEKRRKEAAGQVNALGQQARASARAGGSADPTRQAGYGDYAKAQAGVRDAANLTAGGSGNIWDAAIAAPSWNVGNQAAGAYSQLQQQLSGAGRSAEKFAGKGRTPGQGTGAGLAPPPPRPAAESAVMQGAQSAPDVQAAASEMPPDTFWSEWDRYWSPESL